MEHHAPPASPAPAAFSRLGAFLRDAGYDERGVIELLGVHETLLAREDRPLHRRRLSGGLAAPVRLFLLRDTVDREALAPLDPVELDGLLETSGDGVRATVAIQPWRDLLVCHDWEEERFRGDFVVAVSSISALLSDLTVRRPVERALDVCTGSGVQALLAARHAGQVVATDLGPRALGLAAWSLALNGVDSVELRHGSLFEPVGEERFDLIVANPPFIVSPDSSFLYRDGGGVAISRAVIEGAAQRLREGGFAHVLCQWPLAAGEAWDEQPRAWTSGSGCDAWLLRLLPEQHPVDHAANWNRHLPVDDFEAAVHRWVDHLAAAGVDRIAWGAVSLRRRDGDNWTRADELHEWPAEAAGDHVLRVFEGQTLVHELPDEEALLDLVLQPVDGLRLDETRVFEGGELRLKAAQPRLGAGVLVRPRLSRAAIDVIGRLDGRTPLRDLDAADALPHLRDFVALGFLRVVGR